MKLLPIRVSAPPYCEELVSAELERSGIKLTGRAGSRIEAEGSLECIYRYLIENRTASRLIFPVDRFEFGTADEYYRRILALPWEEAIEPGKTMKIDGTGRSSLFSHTNFPVLKAKDAVVDRLREKTGKRPDIDTENPDLLLSIRLHENEAEIGVDLGGGSLHRRGYRRRGAEAPLKENLAAAILTRADWPRIAGEGGGFLDPFCGSGTLVIEAALMAAGVPPRNISPKPPSPAWRGHDPALWRALTGELAEMRQERLAGLKEGPIRFFGSDKDPEAVKSARNTAKAAGLEGIVTFGCTPVQRLELPDCKAGLICTNPPYGERLETEAQAELIYTDFGFTMRRRFEGWRCSFLAPSKEAGLATGLHAHKSHSFANGPLKVSLLHAEVEEFRLSQGSEMFLNRLKKNRRLLKNYLKDWGETPFRLYDKDMPEYAFAVDIYPPRWCHLQEYAAPSTIEARAVARRRREALEGLFLFLEMGSEGIHIKERRKLGTSDRYGRRDNQNEKVICSEGPLRFFLNFTDYLDTGLFLDSRELRRLIREEAAGKRFLNLFAYTCSASVAAAMGGAESTMSVDASRTYLDWGKENFRLNKLEGPRHRFLQKDSLEFLKNTRERFDLAYIDPPTYSNSKDRRRDFDVQRDHDELILRTAALMQPGGTIIFCTNFTRFDLSAALMEKFSVEEITERTLPPDFSRRGKAHRSFRIQL